MKTIKEAETLIGGLTQPSKMPCHSYNIPAAECRTGSKLRNVKGSVCFGCYALKGNYHRYAKTGDPSRYRRLNAIESVEWVDAMSFLIRKKKMPYFRWHDSGDIQSVEHLEKIAQVARNCPDCKFWLPTREYAMVSELDDIPKNLVIRLSAHMIDGKPPEALAKRLGVLTSTVSTGKGDCPSSKQGNKCLDCRNCWDVKMPNIAYSYH